MKSSVLFLAACIPGLFLCAGIHAAEGEHPPEFSPGVKLEMHDPGVFAPDPTYADHPYNAEAQQAIYGNKRANITQRPLLELGRELYHSGPFQPAPTWFGELNPGMPQFLVYGDYRTAIAYNDTGTAEQATWAHRLNLDMDLRLTSTERVHAFFRPFDKNGLFTRYDFGGENHGWEEEMDFEPDALFFEGDLGAMWAGASGKPSDFDMPFTAGLIPLLFQNGIWLEDAFTGVAFTIPAQNSPRFDISNFDITFFAAFDDVTTPAFAGEEHQARFYGMASFFETMQGYWEVDYAYIEDELATDLDYHNFAIAYTRRYGNILSNSVRLIANMGQDPSAGAQTADGHILLIENSLITSQPSTVVPYINFFAGFDKPQSLARDGGAGGILKNTGILFETDGLTGFPTLDATGQDAWGFAAGLNLLGANLDHQLVIEGAFVRPHGDSALVAGNQYGLGIRYQIPINHAMILRADAMYGWLEDAEDVSGVRMEFRWKF